MADQQRGITTSEFWMSLATIISTMAGALFGFLPKNNACIVLAIIVVGYTLSRGIAKRKPNNPMDKPY